MRGQHAVANGGEASSFRASFNFASVPASTRGDATEWSRPSSAQSVHDDINFPGLEELVDDDLEPSQTSSLIAVVPLAQPLEQPLEQSP